MEFAKLLIIEFVPIQDLLFAVVFNYSRRILQNKACGDGDKIFSYTYFKSWVKLQLLDYRNLHDKFKRALGNLFVK